MIINDPALLELISDKDLKRWDEVYETLYAKHFRAVKRYILKNSGTQEDAEDVFQDAIIVLHKSLTSENFELKSSLETYLFSVARNVWFNELRRRKRDILEEDPNNYIPETEQTNLLIKKTETLRELISQLKGDCQRILIDFYFHNISMKDIMEEYGLGSIQAAKNKKFRCLNRLASLYIKKFKRDEIY